MSYIKHKSKKIIQQYGKQSLVAELAYCVLEQDILVDKFSLEFNSQIRDRNIARIPTPAYFNTLYRNLGDNHEWI